MRQAVVGNHVLSGNEYRVLTEHSPVMIWRSGLDAKCDYFNATWLEFTGRSFEQEAGDGWAEGVHPDDLASCLQTYQGAFGRREFFEMRYRLRRHDGCYRYILDRGVPIYTAEESFVGFVGSCTDVHEVYEAQLALAAQEQLALETSDAIQRRIGRDLHDGLGQLLTGIGFIAKQIEDATQGAVNARSKRLRELICKAMENAQSVARGLAPLHLESTSLEVALKDLAKLTSHAHDVACTVSCDSGPLDLDVGERTQLFLITQEAVANALRHGKAKHIAIELAAQEQRHRLRITDNGCGMLLPATGGGLGLRSMAQRARLIGGVLELQRAAQGGLEVRCIW